MKGVILAAGKGTRLYPVTLHIPKPILPIANKMTLEYAFDQLKKIDITDICVVVGESEKQMKAQLGDGSDFGVKLSYVRQIEQKGLAHALGFAKDFVGQDDFVLYLGDAIYGSNFIEYADKFKKSGCANLNLVKPVEDPSRFGVANVEGDRIVKLVEKPKKPESNLAMAGLYFFNSEIWKILPDLQPSGRGEYEITDAIQMLIDRGHTVLAGIYQDAWFDTGTLDSFLETSRFLIQNDQLIGQGAECNGEIGENVVIGEQSYVSCDHIENSVILPGSKVIVKGDICRSIIGGCVNTPKSILNEIIYND